MSLQTASPPPAEKNPRRAPRRKDTDLLHHENISARAATARAVCANLKKLKIPEEAARGEGGGSDPVQTEAVPGSAGTQQEDKMFPSRTSESSEPGETTVQQAGGSTRKQDAHPHNEYSDFT